MTASGQLAQEAERRASSPAGMAALIHALLAGPEPSALLAQERELWGTIRAYVLTKRQLVYKRRHAVSVASWVSQANSIAKLKRKINSLGEQLGPETFAVIKKRVGSDLHFGRMVTCLWDTD